MHITTNRFCAVSSCLARPMARFGVQQNCRFSPVFKTIVVKIRDDRQCAKWVFAMRAVYFPQRLGHHSNAN